VITAFSYLEPSISDTSKQLTLTLATIGSTRLVTRPKRLDSFAFKEGGRVDRASYELEGLLQMERTIGQDSAVKYASLLDQHTATLAQLDDMRASNEKFREQLPILQAQLSSAQRELEQQSRSSAALMTDSARATKLETDFSASLQHSKKLQEQLITSENIVTAATAAKNEADHKALKATQAHDALAVEFTLLKSDCIAKDSKIRSLQESSAMLKEAVLLLTQKNESLSDSLRGTDMMNSDAVSIIDALHDKERVLNQEKVSLLSCHSYCTTPLSHFLFLCRRLFRCRSRSCRIVFKISKRAN
jgi:hypothetical protein